MGAAAPPAGVGIAEICREREIRDALQWFTREKSAIAETQLQLCRVPAPTFLESQRAEWMKDQLRESGWDARLDRAGNLIALLETAPESGASARPLIALTAHLDTVFAPRAKDEIYVDSDGRLCGPGISDNGAGLTALLAIGRAIQLFGLPEDRVCDPLLVANVGEEGEGNLLGMRHLCQTGPLADRIAAFVVIDGAGTSHITVRGLGSRRFEAIFAGAGGHSWSDQGAANPVHALARAVASFTESRLPAQPRCAVNVGVIEGGAAVNSIATEARAKIDIRSESNGKMDELVRHLFDCVERAKDVENSRATGTKLTAEIREIGCRPAAKLPDDSPLLSAVRAVDAHLGVRAQIECSSTDANIPLSMGLPALSLGAGGTGGGAHSPQEWFNPEGRDLGLKRIYLLLATLLRFGLRSGPPSAPRVRA